MKKSELDYIICKAENQHIPGIIALFKNNYKDGYFNREFDSESELKKLLNSGLFEALVAVLSNGQVIGFNATYLQKVAYAKESIGILQSIYEDMEKGVKKSYTGINQAYLAHFLVDENYRNYGIGKRLEKERSNICKNLPGKTLVYALSLESSKDSVSLKKQLGFNLWGTRTQTIPAKGDQARGNVLIMGCTYGFDKVLDINSVSKMTESVIRSSSPSIKRNHTNHKSTIFAGKAEYVFDHILERAICNVTSDQAGDDILPMIDAVKKSPYPYKAIYIPAQIEGLSYVDTVLIKNRFFPVAFLPYFNEGLDIIEYQYLDRELIELAPQALFCQELIKYAIKNN